MNWSYLPFVSIGYQPIKRDLDLGSPPELGDLGGNNYIFSVKSGLIQIFSNNFNNPIARFSIPKRINRIGHLVIGDRIT